jgi:uncharacterized membrane protein
MSVDSSVTKQENNQQDNGQLVEDKETGRLEAFSDGVFSIAITLLVLNLKVPLLVDLHGQTLRDALLNEWPTYLSYITSFLTILIMWVNHHNLFRQIKLVDHTFLLINGMLLMLVTAIPFPTSLLAEYIRNPDEQTTAAAVYSGTYIVLALLYGALWFYAAANNRLLGKKADPVVVRNISKQYRLGPLFYVVTFIVAFINAWLSVALCLLLALFFALPSSVVAISRSSNGEATAQ